MTIPDDVMKAAQALLSEWGIEDKNDLYATFGATLIMTARAEATAAERERCAKVAEDKLGGYLCPYGRDAPGDSTWDHTDKDICPVCRCNGEQSLYGCHDNVQSRIAAAIRRGDA